ncbi:twin-arginine translocation signal domain-containing protein, partial [Pantoea deleyi]
MPITSSPSRRDFLGQSVRWTAAGGLLAAGLGQASAA